MGSNTGNETQRQFTCRNRRIKVILEFPEQTDRDAGQEFARRMKEVYLQKILEREEERQ